jgi:hypothetical protein
MRSSTCLLVSFERDHHRDCAINGRHRQWPMSRPQAPDTPKDGFEGQEHAAVSACTHVSLTWASLQSTRTARTPCSSGSGRWGACSIAVAAGVAELSSNTCVDSRDIPARYHHWSLCVRARVCARAMAQVNP